VCVGGGGYGVNLISVHVFGVVNSHRAIDD
jgi:hypothetical protein